MFVAEINHGIAPAPRGRARQFSLTPIGGGGLLAQNRVHSQQIALASPQSTPRHGRFFMSRITQARTRSFGGARAGAAWTRPADNLHSLNSRADQEGAPA